MAETIAPFTKVSDVDVIMTIRKPQPVIGLGNLMIITNAKPTVTTGSTTGGTASGGSTTGGSGAAGSNTPAPAPSAFPHTATLMTGLLDSKTDTKSGANFSEYADLDGISLDYPEDTDVYKKAAAYFAQSNHSDRVAVLSIPTDPSKLRDSLEAFWYANWTFAVITPDVVNNNVLTSDTALTLSNIFESNKDHFILFQAPEDAINASGDDIANKFSGQDYTILIAHDLAEPMDAAFVGSTAALTVGTVTWKFRHLNGITAEMMTTGELKGLNRIHAIAYIRVNGTGETSEGWTTSGEYIDNLHGDIWVKTTIESRMQREFQTQDKIPYETSGINLLASIVTGVLEQAWEQGIVLTNEATKKGDYSVTAGPRSAQSQTNLSKRHYDGISFTYHRSGAIHSATINGTVISDTITNAA